MRFKTTGFKLGRKGEVSGLSQDKKHNVEINVKSFKFIKLATSSPQINARMHARKNVYSHRTIVPTLESLRLRCPQDRSHPDATTLCNAINKDPHGYLPSSDDVQKKGKRNK